MNCPAPIDLERGFFSGDVALSAHARGCARCGAAWAEISELRALAASFEAPPEDAAALEQTRALLLAAAPQKKRWKRAPIAAVAAAVAVLLAWMLERSIREHEPPTSGVVVAALGAANYRGIRGSEGEIVRLSEGRLHIEVPPLSPGRGLRVVTGDGEVLVRGAIVEVSASADRLREVLVLQGRAEIRAGGEKRLLAAGERWRVAEPTPAAIEAPRPAALRPEAPPPEVEAPESRVPTRGHKTPRAAAAEAGSQALSPPEARSQETAPPIVSEPSEPTLPENAPPVYERAWEALRAERFAAAAFLFEEALEKDPDEDARYFAAVSWARAGDTTRALQHFGEFLEDHAASPRAGEAAAMAGWLHLERNEDARAATLFKLALTSDAESAKNSARQGLEALRRKNSR